MSTSTQGENGQSATPYNILLDSIFIRSWVAVFLSTSGTFLLLLSLSTVIYEQTGSALWAASVFASQWLFAIASPPFVAWLSERQPVIRILALADAFSVLLTVAIGFVFELSFLAVLGLLAVKGLMEALNKSLRIVPLKSHVPATHIKSAVAYFGTSQYLATGIGAAVGIYLIDRLSISEIAIIDALTFVASAAIYASLFGRFPEVKRAAQSVQKQFEISVQLIKENPLLLRACLLLIAIVVFYQGFHNIARADFAFEYLLMGKDGTMLVQLVSSIAIVVGAVLGGLVLPHISSYRWAGWLLLCTCLSSLLMFAPADPTQLIVSYGIFIFVFEIAFVVTQAEVVAQCPLESLPALNSSLLAIMTFGMMLVVFAGGYFADKTTLLETAFAIAALVVPYAFVATLKTAQSKEIN
ncbi:MFS transporter [Roseibium sp. M-1]